ncbi:MAG: SPOR domain-containing protein [Pseudomonadota bacterium]
MDYALKQRLVGATVLVVLAVVLVPLVLKGPTPEGVVIRPPNQAPVSMPSPSVGVAQEPTILEPTVSEPSASEPPPSESSAFGRSASKRPGPKASAPTPPVGSAARDRPPALGEWVVQIGAFSRAQNAIELRDRIRKKGFPVFVRTVERDGKRLTRVLVGPLVSKVKAGDLAKALAREDFPTRVVKYP